MFLEYRDKAFTVLFQLALPDPGQARELLQVARQHQAHLLQRAVVEDHVGRYALVLRQLAPALAQRLPERYIEVGGQRGSRLLLRRPLAGVSKTVYISNCTTLVSLYKMSIYFSAIKTAVVAVSVFTALGVKEKITTNGICAGRAPLPIGQQLH